MQIDRHIAPAWFALGLAWQNLGDSGGTIEAYLGALSAQPSFHEAALNLGTALQEAGDLEAALDAHAVAWRQDAASFGRIAQAIVSAPTGMLFLRPDRLRAALAQRAVRYCGRGDPTHQRDAIG